ncbi:hypothetical protein A8L34_11055 [Bacillus sp. FJAT-27264]|uniref:hypothetical protein n=1 Tax=Paenibacillus sp. (strain DSM 101736 / FJAT-27264) TaxID=1850362 RepID=UPI000807A8B5|nr:hypothetical protein [Bacillus sp. FJAT-27264]OBZ14468.1 hypothetical protein A8L34_11055 [Bacillus sp. FJAT-27264]
MKERTAKSTLQVFLFISIVFIITSSIQLLLNIVQERPTWLLTLVSLPIPMFVFLAVVIILDLAKQDFMVLKGRLTTVNGNKVVLKISNGRVKKFNITSRQIRELEKDKDIEITYYKRTKTVINVTNI